MKHTTDGDDLPKLIPDTTIYCDFKDNLKQCTDEELIFLDGVYHLLPDTRVIMPNKHRLKRRAPKRLSFTVASLAAAVAAVAIPFATIKNTYRPPTVVLYETLADNDNSQSETNVETETTLVGTVQTVDKSAGEPMSPVQRKPERSSIRSVTVKANNRVARRSVEPLPVIALPAPSATTTTERRIVPRYTHVERHNGLKSILSDIAERKLNDIRIGKLPTFVGLADILKRRSETDKYIEAWIENNRDVPFDIYAEVTNEDKVKEIYDESGTLVKAIFFTSTPVNYGRTSNNKR